MVSLLHVVLFCALFAQNSYADPVDVDVVINTTSVVQDIDENLFVGVTMDCFIMQDNWAGFDFSNKRMLNLAKGLAPSLMRIGGTACDSLTFKPDSAEFQPRISKASRPPYTTNFTMTGKDWDNWNTFMKEVDWKMIFGINAKKRNGKEWDPWNAVTLLEYTAQKGYPIYGFELSNEPNDFPKSVYVSPEQLGYDYGVLLRILKTLPLFANTLIIGPDTGTDGQYFDEFLKSDGGAIVNAATFHQYYLDGGKAVLSQFIDPNILDHLISTIERAEGIRRKRIPRKPVWLGETSSAWSTGAPGISDTFVAGFMWLDKLGLSSKLGIKAVIRQDFYGGNYSLIQQNTFYPNPDYWLTILYKKLVGSHVFNVTVKSDNSVRMYAHCAKQNNEYKYGAGSLVLYAMNMKTSEVKFHLPQFLGQRRDMFWLSAVNNNLTATSVNLNGAPIELINDEIPPLPPVNVTWPIVVPPQTLGFIVLPNANVKACMEKKH